jgi:tetratricopeptide (TPR) repeat protein
VRGAGAGDSAFEAGMRLYDSARWSDAAAALRRAGALGADHDATWFFLGASEMMSGNDLAADSAFARALAVGDGPYAAEARFYRAKTLLRRRQRDAALIELARVPAADRAPIGAHAAALIDSIRSGRIR